MHPDGGFVSVAIQRNNGEWAVAIGLPELISGDFHWGGAVYPLQAGINEFQFSHE